MSLMQCEEAQGDVSALIDGELSGERQQAVATHLATCSICAALAEDYRRIGKTLKAVAYQRAPAGLAERIRLQLAQDELGTKTPHSPSWARLINQAAALVMIAGLSASVAWIAANSMQNRTSLERDIVAAHVRSLLQENATQIASSDRHAVKPWFTGRLDFAPTVQDLGSHGFLLKGGRLDFVGDRRIASVVYMRRLHVINLFMWPAEGTETSGTKLVALKGYNAVTWTTGGIVYWAVSDLNGGELRQFQSLM
jgi:anti-sigma factor RsiW